MYIVREPELFELLETGELPDYAPMKPVEIYAQFLHDSAHSPVADSSRARPNVIGA